MKENYQKSFGLFLLGCWPFLVMFYLGHNSDDNNRNKNKQRQLKQATITTNNQNKTKSNVLSISAPLLFIIFFLLLSCFPFLTPSLSLLMLHVLPYLNVSGSHHIYPINCYYICFSLCSSFCFDPLRCFLSLYPLFCFFDLQRQ